MKCPKCKADVTVPLTNAFICDDYIDIPLTCEVCNAELRAVYDFTSLELEPSLARVTTRDGLLYLDGHLLGVWKADQVAQQNGFMYAERLVKALEDNPDLKLTIY